ncbi:Nucleolar Complex 2 protein [Steccherinum ochraceum]|uniref:Nucleolar Complex 2 protein n=1 Tax=Steccherinum ochraceum TaxID=92696 RepID=A0A4R0R9R3_9APHY|nr:Nucleolar Complex 2 protein [Steccherinum ochraceum]
MAKRSKGKSVDDFLSKFANTEDEEDLEEEDENESVLGSMQDSDSEDEEMDEEMSNDESVGSGESLEGEDIENMDLSELVPPNVGNRKAVKLYFKECLRRWSNGDDAAFAAVQSLASTSDATVLNAALKNTYLVLVRSCKTTTPYTIASIASMKESAADLFAMDHGAAYQHAFGYIRQLAIHLRNSMRFKSKEAYKQVYNWQYVHSVDFWSIVLARACDRESTIERGESELKALIYPLVQVALGAIKLIPNSRSHPLHVQLIRSLIHLSRHTSTYIPLAPYLLPILTSTLSPTSKPKASTLRSLDFDVCIRAPQQYLKTRVYSEGLAEEATYLLAEYLSSPPVHGSIAFPEVVVPITTTLRKSLKTAKGSSWKGKEMTVTKALVERIEESAKWVEQQRKHVGFAPNRLEDVEQWERDLKLEDAPLAKYVKVQKKARDKRRKLLEKARDGEGEMLED